MKNRLIFFRTSRRFDVRIRHAWSRYKQLAWGMDELLPIAGRSGSLPELAQCSQLFSELFLKRGVRSLASKLCFRGRNRGFSLATTMVDSLDTSGPWQRVEQCKKPKSGTREVVAGGTSR